MKVTILAAILILITLILVVFSVYAWTRPKKSAVSRPLTLLMIALSVYSGGYAGELLSQTMSHILLWNRFEYIGISFIPALWIIFAARYMNLRVPHPRVALAILFSVSLVTLFAAITDPILHLRYTTVWIRDDGPFPVLAFTRGPCYWSHTVYSLLSLLIGTILLFRGLFTAPRFFRIQLFLMLLGACLPWVNYSFYLFGIAIWNIDTIPFSMFVSCACFGAAIVGYRILDVIPVARGVVFERMSDAVLVVDGACAIVDFNRAASAIFPELTVDVLSRDAQEVLASYPGLCDKAHGERDVEFPFSTGSGDGARYYQCAMSPIYARPGAIIGRIVLFKDTTETTLLLRRLEELATVDPLTKLFNRRHFIELANKQISYLSREGRSLSIFILDLDNFKRVNDTFGHLAGDEVLKTVSSVIATNLRGCDVAARFGGEEFICLLPEIGDRDAYTAAERMREEIRQTCVPIPGSSGVCISASFGVCGVETVSGDESLDDLIARADRALYQAKRSGRNRTVCHRDWMDGEEASVMT